MEKMNTKELDTLELELSVKAKNGLDFVIAATITWAVITYIWTWSASPYNKSVFTFMAGGLMLPLALGLSKLLKTQWKIEDNPLQPLGLWLNFAQLFYFPFLVFMLLRQPEYFLMSYAIITGAHFFPYAWYYREKPYAVAAAGISLGALLLALSLRPGSMYLIGLYMVGFLAVLAGWLYFSYRKKVALEEAW